MGEISIILCDIEFVYAHIKAMQKTRNPNKNKNELSKKIGFCETLEFKKQFQTNHQILIHELKSGSAQKNIDTPIDSTWITKYLYGFIRIFSKTLFESHQLILFSRKISSFFTILF